MVPKRTRVIVYVALLAVVVCLVGWRFGSRWLEHREATQVETGPTGLEDFLEPWYEALENQDEEPAKVVVVGDSISEGVLLSPPVWSKRMVGLLQQDLRKAVGASGSVGYMPAYYGDALTEDDTVRAGSSAPREEMFGPWGLGGRALLMPAGSSLTYPVQQASRVRVWFGRTAVLGGQGKVLVDGKDLTAQGELSDGTPAGKTISSVAPASRSGLWWTSPELGAGEHTVQVESVAPGSVFVHTGVEFLDGDEESGVHVYDASHSGVAAAHFALDTAAKGHWEDVRAIDPQLVLVNLGTNAEPDYASSLNTVVERALEAAPRARVVLVDGYRPGNWTAEAWEEVRQARQAVADRFSDRVAVFDFASRWPRLKADGSTSDGLMYEDEAVPLHPSEKGQRRMAEIYTELLAPPED